MPSPEKFRETLDMFGVNKEIIEEIECGFGELTSKTSKKTKSAFFAHALTVMNEKLPPESIQKILESNSCCRSGARLKNSREFAKRYAGYSTLERLKLISENPNLNMGSAGLDENGCLVVNAVAYHSGDKFECVCPTISKVPHIAPIPREYCWCCGGHFKFHYEIMLGVKLQAVEIISSPLDTGGEKPCAFRYAFIESAE